VVTAYEHDCPKLKINYYKFSILSFARLFKSVLASVALGLATVQLQLQKLHPKQKNALKLFACFLLLLFSFFFGFIKKSPFSFVDSINTRTIRLINANFFAQTVIKTGIRHPLKL